jgi:chorismate dehydratase
MNSKQRIRIGRINYTNVWPIFYHFPWEQFKEEVEVISRVPTELNEAMRKGEIDMGPISSFAYGETYENYVLLPNLSVSAYGKVNSILLFHRKPLHEALQGTIALSTASATSVNLLKIITHYFFQSTPKYKYAPPILHDMLKEADAALLIGDDAIRASWTNEAYLVTDLGEQWLKSTGQWMTFAVWAVNKSIAERYPELLKRIYGAFVDSKKQALANYEPMVNEAHNKLGGTVPFWRNYFKQLGYDFGPEQWSGLQRYFQYAWELDLVKQRVPLFIWDNKSVVQVKE